MTLDELRAKYGRRTISIVLLDLAARAKVTGNYLQEIHDIASDLESVLTPGGTAPNWLHNRSHTNGS